MSQNVLSPEEARRLRIHASICKRILLHEVTNPEFRAMVERLSDQDVIEVYNGRHEQLLLRAYLSKQKTVEAPAVRRIITACLQTHEKTAPKIPARKKVEVTVIEMNAKSLDIHQTATKFLEQILKSRSLKKVR